MGREVSCLGRQDFRGVIDPREEERHSRLSRPAREDVGDGRNVDQGTLEGCLDHVREHNVFGDARAASSIISANDKENNQRVCSCTASRP